MSAFGSIPNETPIDPSGLKIKGITTRRELNVVEARNINKAALKYLGSEITRRSAKFDDAWCRRLHGEMFGDVWRWAGVLRTKELNLGVPAWNIASEMALLLDDLHSWSQFGIDLIEQATRLHHRAVKVHPFENGNGRWSRMLSNIWLHLHSHSIIQWPETTIGEASTIRAEYIEAIAAADEGDYESLLTLHRRYVLSD